MLHGGGDEWVYSYISQMKNEKQDPNMAICALDELLWIVSSWPIIGAPVELIINQTYVQPQININ